MSNEKKYSGYTTTLGGGKEPWDNGRYLVERKGRQYLVPKTADKYASWAYTFEVIDADSGLEKHIGRSFLDFFSNSPKGGYFGMKRHKGFLVCSGEVTPEQYVDFSEQSVIDTLSADQRSVIVVAHIEPDAIKDTYARVIGYEPAENWKKESGD